MYVDPWRMESFSVIIGIFNLMATFEMKIKMAIAQQNSYISFTVVFFSFFLSLCLHIAWWIAASVKNKLDLVDPMRVAGVPNTHYSTHVSVMWKSPKVQVWITQWKKKRNKPTKNMSNLWIGSSETLLLIVFGLFSSAVSLYLLFIMMFRQLLEMA